MRIRMRLIQVVMLLVLPVALPGAFPASATVRAQTINKPSIQINLRTHPQYYRNGVEDQETWSWTPWIEYRVIGPLSAGSQLSVDFTLPSGKSWLKFDCPTNETKDGYWWPTECGDRTGEWKQQATIETGMVGSRRVSCCRAD